MFDEPSVSFAIEAVREAAALTRRIQADMASDALEKGDRSPVTVGDYAAQAVVARRLAGTLEGVLVGEESADGIRAGEAKSVLDEVAKYVDQDADQAEVLRWIDRGAAEPGEEFWTLDPIDGTKGFLRGDQYAVALALVRDGVVQIGALGCPELEDATTPTKGGAGSLLIAVRGKGAYVQSLADDSDEWRKLSVSSETQPANTRVLRSVEKGHTNLSAIDHLAEAMGVTAAPVGMDSQAKYAVLAAGGGEMLVRLLSPSRPDYREKIWDQAAGSIVVEEAGGRVTDLDGKPLDFTHGRTLANNRGVLVTNGALHDAALAALQEIGA